MRMKLLMAAMALGLGGLCAAGCSGGGTDPVAEASGRAANITVAPEATQGAEARQAAQDDMMRKQEEFDRKAQGRR